MSKLYYSFTQVEATAIRRFAKGEITSRALGEVLNVSHTMAINLAGRYFMQCYDKGTIVFKEK